jgi:DNA-binding protein H-NS
VSSPLAYKVFSSPAERHRLPTLDELLAASARKANKVSGKKVQPQYQNPADTSRTWTGRGRQPKWLTGALASGKRLDDFRMK